MAVLYTVCSLWCGRALLLKQWQQRVYLGLAQRPAAIRIEPSEKRIHHYAPALADLGTGVGCLGLLSLGGRFVSRRLGPDPTLTDGTDNRIKGGPAQLMREWGRAV